MCLYLRSMTISILGGLILIWYEAKHIAKCDNEGMFWNGCAMV